LRAASQSTPQAVYSGSAWRARVLNAAKAARPVDGMPTLTVAEVNKVAPVGFFYSGAEAAEHIDQILQQALTGACRPNQPAGEIDEIFKRWPVNEKQRARELALPGPFILTDKPLTVIIPRRENEELVASFHVWDPVSKQWYLLRRANDTSIGLKTGLAGFRTVRSEVFQDDFADQAVASWNGVPDEFMIKTK